MQLNPFKPRDVYILDEDKVNTLMKETLFVLNIISMNPNRIDLFLLDENVEPGLQRLLQFVELNIPHKLDLSIINKLNKINFSWQLNRIKTTILKSYNNRNNLQDKTNDTRIINS